MVNRHRDPLEAVRALARGVCVQARVPFSGRPVGAVLLLSDGAWVPGVRVESASFSLTLPALLNACTTLVALGRDDVVAMVLSRPFTPGERAYVAGTPWASLEPAADDACLMPGARELPLPQGRLSPFAARPVRSRAGGIEQARAVARRAYVPASAFPVGCVLATPEGRLVPGVNVEHPDWSRVLCAERNALGTAISYGLTPFEAMYLSCLRDPRGSPCGACRQWMVELAPEIALWMDRGERTPAHARPHQLLPGAFAGDLLAPNA